MRQLSPVPCSSQSNIFDVSADDLAPRNDASIPLTKHSTTGPSTLDWTKHSPPHCLNFLPIADTTAYLFQQHLVPERQHDTTRFLRPRVHSFPSPLAASTGQSDDLLLHTGPDLEVGFKVEPKP